MTRMTAGLAFGITAAVSLACAAGAYLYSVRHYETLLESARGNALAQAEMIRAALEHEMMEDDRTLIDRMITTFGREPRVVNVMLLDRDGVVQFSSGPIEAGAELSLESPTCQACHRYPPAQRASSRAIETRGGSILRTVVPFRNRVECHECHEPSHAINGVLISDQDTSHIRAAASRDLRWMVAVSGGIALLLVAAIAIVLRVVILRRLQRFETTARLIAEGDLTRRIPAEGSDTISWLAREFNKMADSVNTLIRDVRSERERLETVINSVDDGIVVLDAERRVVAANDAFLARSGSTREQTVGCSCQGEGSCSCTSPDCPAVACLQSRERQVRICERRKKDGTVAWEEVHASPIATGPGGPQLVVEVWRDISERRAAEARLSESHRLASLGLLASGFSHELNTPLATVLACVEGISRETRNGPADERYIRDNAATAREQVLRCRGITQQFLRMARGQPSIVHPVQVGETIETAIRLIQPTARAHRISIESAAQAGAGPRVRADEVELLQTLVNLLLNAVQASRPGGRVNVEAATGDRTVTISVTDNGCGIAPEHRKHIFEPFFSVRAGGTGLGLFLSLNSVRRWGGDIAVRSTAGEGSTFEVVLPAADYPATRASA